MRKPPAEQDTPLSRIQLLGISLGLLILATLCGLGTTSFRLLGTLFLVISTLFLAILFLTFAKKPNTRKKKFWFRLATLITTITINVWYNSMTTYILRVNGKRTWGIVDKRTEPGRKHQHEGMVIAYHYETDEGPIEDKFHDPRSLYWPGDSMFVEYSRTFPHIHEVIRKAYPLEVFFERLYNPDFGPRH